MPQYIYRFIRAWKKMMRPVPFQHEFQKKFPSLVFEEAMLYSVGNGKFTINFLKSKNSFEVDKSATLKQVSDIILSHDESFAPVKFYSEDRVQLDLYTPLQVFTDGMFYIISSTKNVSVTGAHEVKANPLIPYSLKDLQFPATVRHDIQQKLRRIDLLCQLKFDKPLLETESLTKSDMQHLIVESLAQHKNWYGMGRQTDLYNSWKKIYEKVEDMEERKEKAEEIMIQQAKKMMIWGVPFIIANMAFIFFGTFYFLSWDIVQPIAYFISSGTAIFLAGFYFLKYRRPFSYESAMQFLANKFRAKAYRRVDFDEQLYKQKLQELQAMQWKMKDYFYIRL